MGPRNSVGPLPIDAELGKTSRAHIVAFHLFISPDSESWAPASGYIPSTASVTILFEAAVWRCRPGGQLQFVQLQRSLTPSSPVQNATSHTTRQVPSTAVLPRTTRSFVQTHVSPIIGGALCGPPVMLITYGVALHRYEDWHGRAQLLSGDGHIRTSGWFL